VQKLLYDDPERMKPDTAKMSDDEACRNVPRT
jgi:hypothetical protein